MALLIRGSRTDRVNLGRKLGTFGERTTGRRLCRKLARLVMGITCVHFMGKNSAELHIYDLHNFLSIIHYNYNPQN